MTIPLSPASDRRGPRETLLALTEAYLRRGALDADARRSVARLAGRVTTAGSHGPRPRSPGSLGPGAPAIPEWGPLACALAAMLRGEAEHALRVVNEALRAELVPEALRPARHRAASAGRSDASAARMPSPSSAGRRASGTSSARSASLTTRRACSASPLSMA
ncbi:MAG: hypothetical protein P8Y02_13595, partial [Deinococcales bacterium]